MIGKLSILALFLINLGALISAMGTIFLKKLSVDAFVENTGANNLVFRILSNYNFWLGGVCYVIPIFFWMYLLRDMEVTTLQPLLSVVYIYSIILAYFFLAESPSLYKLLGMAFIAIGVYFVSR